MSTSSVLLVAVSIVAVENGAATLDAGDAKYLQPGDRGQAHYELVVDGLRKRIEVGPVMVKTVTASAVTFVGESGTLLRPGYRVELRLPIDRIPQTPSVPGGPPRVKGSELDTSVTLHDPSPGPPAPAPSRPVLEDPPQDTVPSSSVAPDPVESPDVSVFTEVEPAPSVAPPAAAQPVPVRNVIRITGGRYAVGLDPLDALFFNQTPRHEVILAGFWIDRSPVGEGIAPSRSGKPLTGLSFAQAQALCAELDLRLPTEQEWEVAAQTVGFTAEPGLLEWTASWYRAYPGNSRSETEYGEVHRVLRGFWDGSTEALFTRRFMDPNQGNSQVGFRCVADPR